MKTAALVWLVCLAIYVELLARAKAADRVVGGPLPFPIFALAAVAVAASIWIGVLGWLAAGPVRSVVARLW